MDFSEHFFFCLGKGRGAIKKCFAVNKKKKKKENSLHYSGTYMYITVATFSTILAFMKTNFKRRSKH